MPVTKGLAVLCICPRCWTAFHIAELEGTWGSSAETSWRSDKDRLVHMGQ